VLIEISIAVVEDMFCTHRAEQFYLFLPSHNIDHREAIRAPQSDDHLADRAGGGIVDESPMVAAPSNIEERERRHRVDDESRSLLERQVLAQGKARGRRRDDVLGPGAACCGSYDDAAAQPKARQDADTGRNNRPAPFVSSGDRKQGARIRCVSQRIQIRRVDGSRGYPHKHLAWPWLWHWDRSDHQRSANRVKLNGLHPLWQVSLHMLLGS
jgi:hypothetical protein